MREALEGLFMKRSILFFLLIFSYFPYFVSGAETDYLFVDLYVDGQPFPEGTELVTFDYQTYFISLTALNLTMHSEINWISQEKILSGNLWAKPFNFKPEFEITKSDGELLIPIKALSQIEIDPDFDERRQLINFDTRGKHPVIEQKKLEQRKKIIALMASKQANSLDVTADYHTATIPYIDMQLSANFSEKSRGHSLYTNLSQDLAWHQAKIVANKSRGSKFNGEALFQRKVSDVYQYQFGDLRSLSGRLIETAGRGLGFHFGNVLGDNSNLLKIDGFAESGSEIELYKNDVLFDLIVVGESGFYKFKPIEVFSSNSQYHLIVQHPDGRREKKIIGNTVRQLQKVGTWQPSLRVSDSSKSILYKPHTNTFSGKYFNPEFQYALTEESIFGLGYESIQGVKNNQNVAYSSYDYTASPSDTSWNIKFGGSDKVFYEFNWRLPIGTKLESQLAFNSQQKYIQNKKEQFNSFSYDYIGQSFQLNSAVAMAHVENERYISKSMEASYNSGKASFSANIDNISGKSEREEQYSLISSYSSRWGRVRAIWRKTSGFSSQQALTLSYSKMYEGYYLSAQHQVPLHKRKKKTSLSISKSFSSSSVAINASHTEQLGWRVGFSTSFSFYGTNPFKTLSNQTGRNSGTLSIKGYNDLNNDKVHGPDEPLIDGLSITLHGNPFTEVPLENGKRLLYVPANRRVKLKIEQHEADDHFLKPEFGFIETTIHPGSNISVEIPFYQQFEIEGLVTVFNSAGEELSNSGRVPIEFKMKYSDKIHTYYSEPDGFFFFDGIKSGKYTISIPNEYLKQRNLRCDPCRTEIELDRHTEQFVLLEDFNLHKLN